MKIIKNFKMFESIVGFTDNAVSIRKSVKKSIKESDIESFKELVSDIDDDKSKSFVLYISTEYGRLNFVKYLFDIYHYSPEKIQSAIDWVSHSPIAKINMEEVEEVLVYLRGKL